MANGAAFLSIGEVLALLHEEFDDITISKIRFLESQGLIEPERTPSGYRKFYADDIERLRWILRQQKDHYLPLKVIKDRLATEGPIDLIDGANGDARASGAVGAIEPASGATDMFESAPSPAVRGDLGISGVSFTLDELASAAGLSKEQAADVVAYGLVVGRSSLREQVYDERDLMVAKIAASFAEHGIEPRHLRMYVTGAEREASVFHAVVAPVARQRNPAGRASANATLHELVGLGDSLRRLLLDRSLHD